MRTIAIKLGAAFFFLSSAGLAAGAPPKKHTQARIEHVASKSIGSPTNGHLVNGAHISEAPYLRVVPQYANEDVRWGLEPLVGMIDRAARQVRRQYPDSVLSVGHLSRRGGGEIDRHASHESGRDADIGFYIVNDQKRPVYEQHFVAFTGDGKSAAWPGAHFDDARNWSLVAALLSDPSAHVTHIFVAAPLRARLLAYAEKMGVGMPLRIRASETLAQPRGALPHDDHFHVRIACPAHMQGCVEQPQAHHGAPAPQTHEVASAKKSGPRAHESAAPAPHAAAPAPHKKDATVAKKSEAQDDDAAQAARDHADEAPIPRLTPDVSGLDSVVIPSPLRPAPPIDDVDGVLDR